MFLNKVATSAAANSVANERKYQILCDLGYALLEQGILEKAQSFAEQALAIDEGSDPYCIKARIAAMQNNFQMALTYIEKAIALNEDDSYLVEVKAEIEEKINLHSSNEPLENFLHELSGLANSISTNNDIEIILENAKKLCRQYENTAECTRISEALIKVGLAFAAKAESIELTEKISAYTSALDFYQLANSAFHIAAAKHHLAVYHERLFWQDLQPATLKTSYSLYKEALEWYEETKTRYEALALPQKDKFINNIDAHIVNVTADIELLKKARRENDSQEKNPITLSLFYQKNKRGIDGAKEELYQSKLKHA